MAFEKPVVVIDNGSYNIKAGFSCDNHPVSIFRTVVGRPVYLNGGYGKEYYDVEIGDDAVEKIDDLELSKPVKNGQIVHWDNMERVWHHIFYKELKVAPEDRAVILGCSAASSMTEKIKCCEVFFETLNAPGLCVQPQSALAMYGSGCTSGICVDIGYDTTDINPVFEGGLIKYAHMKTGVACGDISEFLKNRLQERGLCYGTRAYDILDDIQKRCVHVSPNFSVPRNNVEYHRNYKLPNGNVIDVSSEAFSAAELLFQPKLMKGEENNPAISLQEGIVTAAFKCDAELRDEMFEAIIPCGGGATFPGLNERIAIEVENLIHKPVKVVPSLEAYSVAWLGGATFAGLNDVEKIWVMQKQYEEHGVRIIKNKFL